MHIHREKNTLVFNIYRTILNVQNDNILILRFIFRSKLDRLRDQNSELKIQFALNSILIINILNFTEISTEFMYTTE